MTRIHCSECGEELWGAGDASGICANCLELEREELDGMDLEDQLDVLLSGEPNPVATKEHERE